MKAKHSEQLVFRISEILNRKFIISDFPLKKTKKIEDQVKFELKFKLSPNLKKNNIDVEMSMLFTHIDTNKIVCNLDTSFIFDIVDLSNYIDGSTFKSDQIPVTLLSVSYATFRGIISEKLNGTKLGSIPPLPLIDPKKFLSLGNRPTKI